jgi:glutaredoxin 3
MGATSSVNRSAFVRETVHDNCVVIFSTTTCGYCRMAKDVFNKMGINYKVIELNQLADGGEIMQALRPITNMSTVCAYSVHLNCP